ncbi:unannotated protein [freshwater metagenome]|jgi:small subunit ribosomal protein S6|uniref:Unannotated protein n=1 Tax=freshwater metagenome TaxID=449393 RepID=A0A6J7HFT9_9ZZZZ|nr:30S ribosomal protein S6 [Actinomycetota bacterium]
MAAPAPTYDLMLLLDSKTDEDVRTKIRTDVRSAIESQGTLVGDQAYGRRTLSYEIADEGEAEYDLLQFTGPNELLEHLNRTLRITDGVRRFRIIKVRPGTPAAPDLRQAVTAAAAEAAPAHDADDASDQD